MDDEITKLQNEIMTLKEINGELTAHKNEYLSAKQSLNRMSSRLRKLCKKLIPINETVIEMQSIANEIREHAKTITLRNK